MWHCSGWVKHVHCIYVYIYMNMYDVEEWCWNEVIHGHIEIPHTNEPIFQDRIMYEYGNFSYHTWVYTDNMTSPASAQKFSRLPYAFLCYNREIVRDKQILWASERRRMMKLSGKSEITNSNGSKKHFTQI